ncbi:MAG: hypothetical protein SFT94_11770 [Pseudanabaenaceae cyanobacterium bins.68]|nr:hypothetical protein [Pseudanabaenaceae cyanobacterium bins.68]
MRKYNFSDYSYGSRRRSWLKTTLIVIGVGLPGLLFLGELAARALVGLVGNPKADQNSLALAYGLKPINSPQPTSGKLLVRSNPLLGYELMPQQKNQHWQINEQGFRSDRPVLSPKPENEIRLFLVGNSTAFGLLAPQNQQTIAAQLEKLLSQRIAAQNQQPDKFKPLVLPYYADQVEALQNLPPRLQEGNYRVITAAVPGYNSGNELALVAHRLMALQPDGIILLNGYEDLRSPSRELGSRLVLPPPPSQYWGEWGQGLSTWVNQLATVQLFQSWFMPKTALSAQVLAPTQFSSDPQEVNLRLQRYQYNLRQIRVLAGQIPLLVALQPEITGKRTKLTAPERQILKNLSPDYRQNLETGYQALNQSLSQNLPAVKLINLYRALDNNPAQTFADPIHLTPAGNQAIAQILFKSLEQTFAVQPIPPT